eukprot:1895173-Pyramimonas_sp.AAC.1
MAGLGWAFARVSSAWFPDAPHVNPASSVSSFLALIRIARLSPVCNTHPPSWLAHPSRGADLEE